MDRTVLITGANSGIGLATAIELGRRGFRSVGSVRSAAKAKAVAAAAAQAGVEVETVLVDVTDAAGSARVIDGLRPWGPVTNTGYSATGAIEDVSDDEARLLLETMVVAPMRLARLALPHMRAAGGGRIVNVSSIYGRTTTPLTGWYQGAKHALEGLSDALRMEVAGDGIAVILVEPGGFRTRIWEEAEREAESRQGSRYATAYRRSRTGIRLWQPFMGDPASVAAVIGRALGAWFPCARYLVGYDAQVLALADQIVSTTGDRELPRARPEAVAALLEPPPRDRDGAMARAAKVFRTIGSPGFPFDEARVRERAGRSYDRCFHPAGVARQMLAILAAGSRAPALRHVRVPTLVIHGTEDPLVPVAHGIETAALV